jgi:hypothetical protein
MNENMLPGSGEQNDESPGPAFHAITLGQSPAVEKELRIGTGGFAERRLIHPMWPDRARVN